ncbi:MAG TPA: hypothetical protein VGF14_02335 [Alphaproteobacteria bacterium]
MSKEKQTTRRALNNISDVAIPKDADTTLHISFKKSRFTDSGFSREEIAYAHLSIKTEKNIFREPRA